MAVLRGAQVIWNNVSVANNGSSAGAVIGAFTNVALFIVTDAAAGFLIQAAYNTTPAAGGNQMPLTDGTQESLWFNWLPSTVEELDGSTPHGVSLSAAQRICIELSPFSPPYLRLLGSSTVNGAMTTANVTAYVAAVG